MRKLKLVLIAFMAMVGLGAQAQDWVSAGAGTYLLYNVGTDSYFTKGNGWGTQASITSSEDDAMTVELVPVGNDFQIRTYGNDGNADLRLDGVENLSGGTVYTDQSRRKVSTWTFTNVGTDAEPVYNIISADNHGGGAGAYLTAEGGESTIVGPGTDGTSVLAKWKIKAIVNYEATRAGIIATMEAATLAAPVDVTGLIGNANFSTPYLPIYWAMASNDRNLCGGNSSNPCAESYRAPFTLSQTIKNIPNGKYELTAQAAYGSNPGAVIYANDKTSPFVAMTEGENSMGTMSGSFSDGKYRVDTITVIVTDGTLTIGAKTERNDAWNIWDNFQLKYFGVDLSALQGELADKVAATAALEGTIPTAAYNALNAVVSEYNKTYSTAAGYEEAIGKIEEATTNAHVLVAPYAAYKVAAEDAAIAGVAAATINAQNTDVEAATTVEAIEACTNVLRTAIAAVASFDITSFTIKNPNPVANQALPDNWEGDTFGDASHGVSEYWNRSGAGFHQTIANLPAGRYCLTVVALQRTGMTGTVYAGEKRTVIAQVPNTDINNRAEAADWFNDGNGRNYVYFSLEETSDVTIGLKADETFSDHWTVWQSFKLDTFDESVAAGYLAPGWTTLVEEAQATHDDAAYANVTGEEKTALETAIAATPSTIAEYQAAVEALNAAVAAFTAAAPAYNDYAAYKAETVALWGTDFNVAAPTSAGECATATQNLNIAQYNKVASDYTFSCTGLIGGFGSWTGTATVGGQPGTPNYLNWEHWSGAEHAYYEQDANGWDNSAGWTIKYVKTCTLPAGSYVIKVAARSSAGVTSKVSCTATETTIALPCAGNNTRGINTSGEASWSDEDTFANTGYYYEHPATEGGTGTGWQWRFLPFTLAEEGEVTMAFEAETNARYQWMSIGDGELLSTTKLARDIVFNEGQENVIENTLIADVTMNRTIKEGYNTVVLPFALTDNQVTAAFGTETAVYNFSEDSPNPMKATINFSKGDGSIIANTPVLVWTTQASEQQTFEGVQIVAPTDGAKVVGTNFDFVGTYNPSTVVDGDYFIGNGALYKSAGATTINAFRAYINTKVQGGEVRMLIDGKEATGISTINRESITNNRYYNLSGQRVDNPKKGLYIVNGRKVVIK